MVVIRFLVIGVVRGSEFTDIESQLEVSQQFTTVNNTVKNPKSNSKVTMCISVESLLILFKRVQALADLKTDPKVPAKNHHI